jgi:hypothetical protein
MTALASLILFLIAAKSHGRELRLEREAAGVPHVVFGGVNPPVVERIWRAERVRFAIVAPLLVLLFAAGLRLYGSSAGYTVLGALAFGPALAFLSLGIASFVRSGAFARGQLGGSLVWWALVIGMGCALGWLGWA